MLLYHVASLTKAILGIAILLIVYTSINVYEDPAIAIGLGFVGLFIASRGVSFYLFLGIQKVFRQIRPERIIADSYKLSLIFGIYAMVNVLLLLLGSRSKRIGLILLIGFVLLQVVLFKDTKQ